MTVGGKGEVRAPGRVLREGPAARVARDPAEAGPTDSERVALGERDRFVAAAGVRSGVGEVGRAALERTMPVLVVAADWRRRVHGCQSPASRRE